MYLYRHLVIFSTCLGEELGQQVAHIEELLAVIQRLGGEAQRPTTCPPSNLFQGVPQ